MAMFTNKTSSSWRSTTVKLRKENVIKFPIQQLTDNQFFIHEQSMANQQKYVLSGQEFAYKYYQNLNLNFTFFCLRAFQNLLNSIQHCPEVTSHRLAVRLGISNCGLIQTLSILLNQFSLIVTLFFHYLALLSTHYTVSKQQVIMHSW